MAVNSFGVATNASAATAAGQLMDRIKFHQVISWDREIASLNAVAEQTLDGTQGPLAKAQYLKFYGALKAIDTDVRAFVLALIAFTQTQMTAVNAGPVTADEIEGLVTNVYTNNSAAMEEIARKAFNASIAAATARIGKTAPSASKAAEPLDIRPLDGIKID